ncbi:MAG: thioesterase family protein [Anaerolineae bacterium]
MNQLTPGVSATVTWQVSEAMTASQVGSGLVRVFSTPMLVALMESAAVEAIAPYLEQEETSVGIRIDVQHLAATPVGLAVSSRATLTQVEGRKLTFEIEAWDDVEPIGRAVHERFIVNRARFEARANGKAAAKNPDTRE